MKPKNVCDCGGPWHLWHLDFFKNHLKLVNLILLWQGNQDNDKITKCNIKVSSLPQLANGMRDLQYLLNLKYIPDDILPQVANFAQKNSLKLPPQDKSVQKGCNDLKAGADACHLQCSL